MYEKMDIIMEKVRKGEIATGSHIQIGNIVATDIISRAGFDMLWIDTEHGPIDKYATLTNIIAAGSGGAAVWVRIPWNDPVLAKPILEMGPDGIIIPLIRSAEDAKNAVAACSYPPDGVRGFGPMRAVEYGAIDTMEYINTISKKMWKIVQIEHIDAVNCLDDILDVPGLDAIIVGSYDLSGSMGILGQMMNPELLKTEDMIAEAARRHNKPFGTSMGMFPEKIKMWKNRGANFIFVGSDASYLADGAKNTYHALCSYIAAK